MIKAAVYGATGYGGAELLRLLIPHPDVEVIQATSREPGRRIDVVHPAFRGVTDLELTESKPESLDPDLDVVFMALPHGDSLKVMDTIIARCPKAKIIDLAQDYRTGAEDQGWTYGLAEVFREQVVSSNKIACPGCFATSILLATVPAVQMGLGVSRIIVDAKTGSSGSGAVPKPLTHHPARAGTVKAYKVFKHQHEIEIKATWSRLAESANAPAISFVPQSVSHVRGIYSCCYLLRDGSDSRNAVDIYREYYAGQRFVQVLDTPPNVLDVRGTNNCALYVEESDGLTLVLSAIDNLCRGASGQAVQCMNLAFGLPEDRGLNFPALNP